MFRLFNLRRWPFWLKLTVTISVALLAVQILHVSALELRAREEADARLRDYLTQTALTRRERLETELQNAFSTITEASTAAYLRPRLLRLLQITGTPSGADIVARSEATDLLNFRLVANGIFEYVRVLTPEGIVAASVFPEDMPADQRELLAVTWLSRRAGRADARRESAPDRLYDGRRPESGRSRAAYRVR